MKHVFLTWKYLILCSVLFNGIIQQCPAMYTDVYIYTVRGEEVRVCPVEFLDKYQKEKIICDQEPEKIFLMQNKNDASRIVLKVSSHQSLLDEAFFLEKLKGHDGIISYNGIFYKDQNDIELENKTVRTFFLDLEYAEKGSLFSIVKNQKVEESMIRELAGQILKILLALNKEEIVHLDIKLDNFVETKDNKLKIIDFAQAEKCEWPYIHKKKLEFEEFDIIKDFNYMPPELDKGCPYKLGPKADLWSFGYLLYCLVTGKGSFNLPFNESRTEITIPFDDPQWELVSKELKDLIKNLMVCNPDARLSIEQVAKHPWFEEKMNDCLLNN